MIKKQYERAFGFTPRSYFDNFIDGCGCDIEEALKPYKATMGKSKRKHTLMNVKWHDAKLYTVFVLRWS